MNITQYQIADVMPTQPVALHPDPPVGTPTRICPNDAQVQPLSSTELRRCMVELNRSNAQLQEYVREREKTTRNVVGFGVLTVVLAVASITTCLCPMDLHSNIRLIAERSINPQPDVLITMR